MNFIGKFDFLLIQNNHETITLKNEIDQRLANVDRRSILTDERFVYKISSEKEPVKRALLAVGR